MPNLISLLKNRSIENLDLPSDLEKKLRVENIQTLWDLFSFLQKRKANPEVWMPNCPVTMSGLLITF